MASTNGQICYGVLVQDGMEGVEFPWTDYSEDGEEFSLEDWWLFEKTGFSFDFPYGEDGELLPGKTKKDSDDYFEARRQHLQENPLPVEMVNVCSGECPSWILAVPGTVMKAHRGHPKMFFPHEQSVPDCSKFLSFLDECHIAHSLVGWYLSSYWG